MAIKKGCGHWERVWLLDGPGQGKMWTYGEDVIQKGCDHWRGVAFEWAWSSQGVAMGGPGHGQNGLWKGA